MKWPALCELTLFCINKVVSIFKNHLALPNCLFVTLCPEIKGHLYIW